MNNDAECEKRKIERPTFQTPSPSVERRLRWTEESKPRRLSPRKKTPARRTNELRKRGRFSPVRLNSIAIEVDHLMRLVTGSLREAQDRHQHGVVSPLARLCPSRRQVRRPIQYRAPHAAALFEQNHLGSYIEQCVVPFCRDVGVTAGEKKDVGKYLRRSL